MDGFGWIIRNCIFTRQTRRSVGPLINIYGGIPYTSSNIYGGIPFASGDTFKTNLEKTEVFG